MVGAVRETLDHFFSEKVKAALRELPREAGPLEVSKWMRREFSGDLARWCAELFELRIRAVAKFGHEVPLFFTRKGLEQATPPAVADFRAERIRDHLGICNILDSACGIGSDSLAFARAGLWPIAADLDRLHLRCTRENLLDQDFVAHTLVADAGRPAIRAEVYFADPDQRSEGKRRKDPEHWSPSLSRALAAAARFEAAAIKLPPALDVRELERPRDSSLTWVSRDRQLYELTMYVGKLAGEPVPEAILLRDGEAAARYAAEPRPCAALSAEAARSIRFITEADPAILRAGLLGNLALDLGSAPLDAHIAYLGSQEMPPETPFARSWRVLGTSSVHSRPVRALLAEHDVGPLVVKKRGFPEDAAGLSRRLRGKGSQRGLLFVTRLGDGHIAYLAEEIDRPN